jgi:TPR repeat protein
MENFELYIILALIVIIIWFIVHTIKFYHGEKRKVKNLHRFAKEGEVDAQSTLAKRYQKGDMVKKDCQRAAFWYQKASFSGDEGAKGHLEKFLDNGAKGIKKKKC